MKLRRFFVEGEPLRPGERLVTGTRVKHLTRTLRLGVGDNVLLFDGRGREFPAEILEVGPHLVRFKVADGEEIDRESPLHLVLAQALSRPAPMDLIVQKATELGVHEVIPVRTERSQRWLADNKIVSRIKRWERIAQEAARQSGRNQVPHIWPLTDFPGLLKLTEGAELRLIFWEEGAKGSLRQILEDKENSHHVCVFVGPEGGFSAKEVEHAVAAGFCKVSLGRRILRTETAAITVVGLLQYELGDLA